MLQLYLPIAELSVSLPLILLMGAAVGVLSGIFGVGGGFLMTPLLIFVGIPPAIAVGTQANQLVAASVSGVLAHWRRRNVDFTLGLVMLTGSALGTVIGVWLFSLLKRLGQIDLVISLSYVLFLGVIGGLMLIEATRALRRRYRPSARPPRRHHHSWLHHLPFRMRFPRSGLYMSALLPLGIGFLGGVLVAIMGIGGGFFLVPAMIYLIGMPAKLVPGTSLFQIIFSTAIATLLHATVNHTVDFALALLLLLGGVFGAQWGPRIAGHLSPEIGRLSLAILVLAVGLVLLIQLVLPPADPFSLTLVER